MADKLRWFPFYAGDWMTDSDVLELTGEQMGAYLWLLCLQWQQGSLPYEVHRVVAMSPRGIPEPAISYVFIRFFPADPDTNERRNPKLAAIREKQLATYQVRVESIDRARKSKRDNASLGDQHGDHVDDHDELLSFSSTSLSPSVGKKGGLGGNETLLREALAPYPDALAVLDGLVRASQRPYAVVAAIRALGPGGTRESGSWGNVAHGLVEAGASPGTLTPNFIAGCVRKAKERGESGPSLDDAFGSLR